MNAIFFGLKRAFHSTLRVTRRMLTQLGLTAARFDMLFALPHESRRIGDGMWQSDLRRELGVSRPTVSRMLASLEELGLVLRKRDSKDRRQVFVALTEAGRVLIRNAERIFIHSGYIQLAVDTALGPEAGAPTMSAPTSNRWYDEVACMIATEAFEDQLDLVRSAFGDFARLVYGWHLDD
jgi:DNA-binding MarR family transcriptional regulator